jgi:hypothetical protein
MTWANSPCHVSRNFLPFKGESPFLSSQAAPFFSFAKGIYSLLQRNPAHMTRAIVTAEILQHLRETFIKPTRLSWAACQFLEVALPQTKVFQEPFLFNIILWQKCDISLTDNHGVVSLGVIICSIIIAHFVLKCAIIISL